LVVCWFIVVSAAVIPAWLSYRYIEQPFRDWQWLKEKSTRALRAGGSLMATTGVCGIVVLIAASQLAQQNSQPLATDESVGAEVVEDEPDAVEPVNEVEAYSPDVTGAQDDLADIYDDGCFTSESSSDIESCVYGDED